MIIEDNTLLKPFSKIVLNDSDKRRYEESYRYFKENQYKFFFLYNSSIIGFLFKKKKREFLEKTAFFDAISRHNALYRAYKMAELIANEDYSVNHLSHYIFDIDGKKEIFGIIEIHPCIFYTANILKSKIKKDTQKETVVINLFDRVKPQDKTLIKNTSKDLIVPDNVIPFNK